MSDRANRIITMIACSILVLMFAALPFLPKKPDELEGWRVAEAAVRLRLKAPSTAKFPREMRTRWHAPDHEEFNVVVDAKNSFGVPIRNLMVVRMVWKEKSGWTVLGVESGAK